ALRAALAARPAPVPDGLELGFHLDPRLYDGRFANNPWLLELADPATGLCWDNALELSPRTAARLGLATGDMVKARWNGRTLPVAVRGAEGQADEPAAIALGWGRRGAGRHADGAGFNASLLRESRSPWFGIGLQLEKTGARHPLAFPQQHFEMEGREIAIE